MKSKQVLSVEQMKHLQEIGLELRNTSMLLWYKQMLGKIPISDWELSVWRESLFSVFRISKQPKITRNIQA